MKKLFCVLLAALLLLSATPALAENSKKVEISFFVGDETLTINGEPVTVEKPYIVGEGVTLVPLRVITEAFGATVEWIGETKSIVLTYPDVSILLQIDNPIAEINGKAEQLLSAPELTPTGFTMVPLRFISENFGATVSYEHETQKITVVKEDVASGNLVEGAITAQNIGDSFFGWSMKNPTNMQMVDREFDGTYTEFAYDANDGFYLSIKMTPDDYDLERDFNQWKSEFSGMTLMKADKKTVNGVKTMHFQAKDQSDMLDVRVFMTDTYGYLLMSYCDNSNTERKTELLDIIDSFTLTYPSGDIHDLSNSKNGMRTFTSETMKFSIDVPQAYFQTDSADVQNEFLFTNPLEQTGNSYIHVTIYSKSETGSAKEMAEKDYTTNKRVINTTMVTFQEVAAKTYANFSGYEYTMKLNGTVDKRQVRDVFFEVGDYVYNVAVATQLPDKSANQKLDAVLNSVKAEELNVEDIGLLLRPKDDEEGTYTVKEGNWSITVPNSYEEIASASDGTILQNKIHGTLITLTMIPANGGTYADARKAMENMEKTVKAEGGTVVKKTHEQYVATMRSASIIYSMENDDGQISYYTQYAGIEGNNLVIFVVAYPELAYCQNNMAEVDGILKTFTMK